MTQKTHKGLGRGLNALFEDDGLGDDVNFGASPSVGVRRQVLGTELLHPGRFEALGFKRLLDEHGHTQEKLAAALGKSRSHIANMVRLLNLPDTVQDYLRDGQLSMGHARALVTAKAPDEIANAIIAQNLNVRQAEKLAAQGASSGKAKKSQKSSASKKDPDTLAVERDITDALGMRVAIEAKGKKGRVTIDFRDLDQLDEILNRLRSQSDSAHRLRA